MENKKIVCTIKPFNDFPLSGCFKHQILSALNGFKISPLLYITNIFYTYKLSHQYLKAKTLQFSSYSKIFSQMNLKMLHKRKIKNTLLHEIKKQLLKNRVIIIPCDCYALSYRMDMYRQLHSLHYILIYGFDEVTKSFYCIDHSFLNSFEYKRKKIKFLDIENGFQSFITNYYQRTSTLLFVLYPKSKLNNQPISFVDNIQNHFDEIKNGLIILKQYLVIFHQLIQNRHLFMRKIEKTYQNIVKIRQMKERQKYQFSFCFKNSSLNALLSEIIKEYTMMIAILYKCFITKKYYSQSILNCFEKFKSIYCLEERLCEKLHEIIKLNKIL